MSISFEDFAKIDIRVGRVISVEPFPEGKYSTHILQIDFGSEIGTKKSLAKLRPRYEGPELAGSLVIAVVNFEPKQIGKHFSEVLTLGVPDADGNAIVLHPEFEVPLGGKLF
jgi:tRNA-binding protein